MKGASMPNGEHILKAGVNDEPRTPLNICPNPETNVIGCSSELLPESI